MQYHCCDIDHNNDPRYMYTQICSTDQHQTQKKSNMQHIIDTINRPTDVCVLT
jgi:hypothetical protein